MLLVNNNGIVTADEEFVELDRVSCDELKYKNFIPQLWADGLSPLLFYSDGKSLSDEDFFVVARRMASCHVLGWIKLHKSPNGFFHIISLNCNDPRIIQELIGSMFYINLFYFGESVEPVFEIPFNLYNKNLLSKSDLLTNVKERRLVYFIKPKHTLYRLTLNTDSDPIARLKYKLKEFSDIIQNEIQSYVKSRTSGFKADLLHITKLYNYCEHLRLESIRIAAIRFYYNFHADVLNCEKQIEYLEYLSRNSLPKVFSPKILINE